MANDDDKKAAEAAYLKLGVDEPGWGDRECFVAGHLAGIAYLRNELMKGAGDFETDSATISAHAKHDEYRAKCVTYNGGTEEHWFVEGARWQHNQTQWIIQAWLSEEKLWNEELGQLKAELAECYEGKAALVEDVQGSCLDLEKAQRELAEANATCVKVSRLGTEELTAERGRAKGLISVLNDVLDLAIIADNHDRGIKSVIRDALAAYRNKENK